MKICSVLYFAAAIGSALAVDLSPKQLRLAYHGTEGISISWSSKDQDTQPTVKWGESANNLTNSAVGDAGENYPTAIYYSNKVRIDGLEPNNTYFYTLEHEVNQSVHSFTTAAKGGRERFTFAYVADMGLMGPKGLSDKAGKGVSVTNLLTPGERNTIDSLTRQIDNYDFIWHGGDLAYADYWLKEEIQGYLNGTIDQGIQLFNELLNMFYDEIEPLSSQKPYMVVPGNHDATCDDGGYKQYNLSICPPGQRNFTGYRNQWDMPADLSKGYSNMWFSFNHGSVHFVTINTETDLGDGILGPGAVGGSDGLEAGPFGTYLDQQVDWLKKDLRSVNRCETPWVIVTGHRPWYVADEPCLECGQAFEQIFIDYHVDIVFSGHVHNYQRWFPIANNVTDPRGYDDPAFPWYVLNGAGGHYDGLTPVDHTILNKCTTPFTEDTSFGWGRVNVHNNTHLTYEFISSNNDSVLDSQTLYKSHRYAKFPLN